MLKYFILFFLGASPAWSAQMLELNYLDKEPDTQATPMRFLITDRFMRIDNGQDQDDFLLMDRLKKRISNVTHENREILQIDAGVVSMVKPAKWNVHEEIAESSPPALGKSAKLVSIYVNGVLCTKVTAMEGFLPDAAAAFYSYNETLSAVQAQTYMSTPPELQNDCDLAQNVFEYGREVKYGLPIETVYRNGRTRHIVGYQTRKAESQLFTLPKQYNILNMKDIRGNSGENK